jgi:hypothetical protein
MGSAGGCSLGQCDAMQVAKHVLKPVGGKPVAVDRVGVCGRDIGAGRKVIGVDLPEKSGMIHHRLRRPQWGRAVASPAHDLLTDAAIEKCHLHVATSAARLPDHV